MTWDMGPPRCCRQCDAAIEDGVCCDDPTHDADGNGPAHTPDEGVDPRIKTARAAGCVGANALVPRLARELLKKGGRVVDFGCGPEGLHVRQLITEGYRAVGYDLGVGVDVGWALTRKQLFDRAGGFDLVYASNVINVQETTRQLWDTCNELRVAAGWGFGHSHRLEEDPCPILLNYPRDPRKLGWSMRVMKDYLINVCFGAKPESIRPGVMLFRPPARNS